MIMHTSTVVQVAPLCNEKTNRKHHSQVNYVLNLVEKLFDRIVKTLWAHWAHKTKLYMCRVGDMVKMKRVSTNRVIHESMHSFVFEGKNQHSGTPVHCVACSNEIFTRLQNIAFFERLCWIRLKQIHFTRSIKNTLLRTTVSLIWSITFNNFKLGIFWSFRDGKKLILKVGINLNKDRTWWNHKIGY